MENTKPRFVAESVCVPGDANTTHVSCPRPMPCVVIFVHGVNSEGEWYAAAEQGLINGINERLGRTDLEKNGLRHKSIKPDLRPLNSLDLKNSPVIRFYWGYRAPVEETDNATFKWRIPLKTRVELYTGDPGLPSYTPYNYPAYSYRPNSYDPPRTNVKGGVYYWGGGPFQNGTSALSMSWYDGFNPWVWGVNVGSTVINPERDRPLNACPKRTYYVNASKRLAALIDRIYDRYPNDTIAVVSHSQGTMIASLAMFYVKRVPDTLFLCNSPYRLNESVLDGFQMGNAAPTTRARVKTFFNLLDLFRNTDYTGKTTAEQLEGVGGWREADTPPPTRTETGEPIYGLVDNRQKWTMEIAREKNHRNHGRVFIYCSPHDRVMGSTPLQSIGWKGVDKTLSDPDGPASFSRVDPFRKYEGVLFQRQFMRGHEVGGEPDANTPRLPKDGVVYVPSSPKVMDLSDELQSIGKDETINVNGPAVPKPVSEEEMAKFDEDIYARDNTKLAADDDYMYYEELYEDKPTWVKEPDTPYDSSNQPRYRLQTKEEIRHYFSETNATPTNHSTILTYGEGKLVERIMAYDLPIGRAKSFEDRDFWKELHRMADWLEEDPDYQQGGDFDKAGDPPSKVDCETTGQANAQSIYTRA